MLNLSIDIFWKLSFSLFLLIIPSLVSGPAIPDILISILSLFGLFLIIFDWRHTIYYKNKILLFLLIFYVYLNINSLLSFKVDFSFGSSIFYLRFIFFSIFVFFLLKKFNYQLIKFFFIISIITIVIIGIDSFKQYLTGVNFFGIISTNFNRPSGLFREELIIGSFISRNTPLLLSLFFFIYYNKINEKKFFLILSFFIILINLFIIISGERAALVLIGLINLFVFFIIPVNKKVKIKFLLLILIFLFFFFTFFETARERMIIETYNQIFNDDGIYIFSKQHQSHYYSSILMFLDSPIFGQGVNTFRLLCSDNRFLIDSLTCSTHPHNSYLQLLSETGIIGFLFLFTFYLYNVFLLVRVIKFKKNNKYFYPYIFLILSFLINFFPFIPSNNFFNNWINIIYFLPLGFFLYFNSKISFIYH